MAQYLDLEGLQALWKKVKQSISDGVGTIDLTPYLKTENLATINGNKLSEGGNITIDLTLFKVVEILPTSNIDENKIYLVKSTEEGEGNIYAEYIYANGAWEKLGEYKSEVDLTPYVKKTELLFKSGEGEGSIVRTGDDAGAATGKGAVNLGSNIYGATNASGINSYVEGQVNNASGECSHAEGTGNTVTGGNAHAEGSSNTVTGDNAHAEGSCNTVTGDSAHAEGEDCKAIESVSHAEGISTVASGEGSHAEGGYTIATRNYSHAEGWFNVGSSLSIHSVGIGGGETTRKSAEEIFFDDNNTKNGYKYLLGIGGFDGTNFEVNNALNPNIKSVQEVINEATTKLESVAESATADSAIDLSVIEALS